MTVKTRILVGVVWLICALFVGATIVSSLRPAEAATVTASGIAPSTVQTSHIADNAVTAAKIAAAVAGDGLQGGAGSALAVDVSDFAGTGLEDDGSENLRIKVAATQTISADNFTITHGDAPVLLLTNDGGDHRVSDGTTAVANGTVNGQKLRIIYVAANSKRITIKDDANTKLSGNWHVAREEAWLELVWDGSDWLETGRGNNSATLDGYDSAGVGGILSSIGEYAYCSAVLGGGYNTVSAGYSVVVGGVSNTASGLSSVVVGGSANEASGEGAVAMGKEAQASLPYQVAHANGEFAATGDAQITECVARIATTDQAFNEMFLDGATASSRFVVADEKLYAVTITIAARMDTGTTECAMFKRMLTIERTGGTVVLQNAAQTIGTDINPGADYNVQLTADDTNKSLKIEVKHDDGVGAKNVRWVASIEAVEIAYSD